MRPTVKPAVRVLWRDLRTVQFGVDPERALVVGGVDGAVGRLLRALDGTRTDRELQAYGRELGVDGAVTRRLLQWLGQARVVDDAARPPAASVVPPDDQDRLEPDLAVLSLLSDEPDGGASLLLRRRSARVQVIGAGRVGATVAALLVAAGVGHVAVDDPSPVTPADCAPGGLGRRDVGSPRADAVRRRLHAISPSVRTDPIRGRRKIVVLAPPGPFDATVGDGPLREGVPHLLAFLRERSAVVGPLVLPGESPCLRCLDLHRAGRDPAWPLLAAQLATGGPGAKAAGDVVTATLLASVCALQVLGFIEGRRPATVGATLQLTLPDWRLRRRRWSLHPSCGCAWPAGEGAGFDAG